ncbi:hypothetical protein DPEC_G00380180, partial [Dallia pectoralis]
ERNYTKEYYNTSASSHGECGGDGDDLHPQFLHVQPHLPGLQPHDGLHRPQLYGQHHRSGPGDGCSV